MPNLNSCTLAFYTAESTFTHAESRRTAQPYDRVVGLSVGGSEQWGLWTPQGAHADEFEYKRADLDVTTIAVTETFAERIIDFYQRFLVDGVTHGQRANLGQANALGEFYTANCHRFGYWMSGRVAARRDALPEEPSTAREGFKATPPFRLGQHAVLGNGGAVHSVVGIGEQTDTCVQVMSTSGPMGLDTYDRILDYYDPLGEHALAYFV